jgi:hypothetical protein
MGESRMVDDMVCELWGEIEGVHCYLFVFKATAGSLWRGGSMVAWSHGMSSISDLGSEIALPQAKGVTFRVASDLVVCNEQAPSHRFSTNGRSRTLSPRRHRWYSDLRSAHPESSPFPVAPPRPSAETPTPVSLHVLHNPRQARHGPSLLCYCSA